MMFRAIIALGVVSLVVSAPGTENGEPAAKERRLLPVAKTTRREERKCRRWDEVRRMKTISATIASKDPQEVMAAFAALGKIREPETESVRTRIRDRLIRDLAGKDASKRRFALDALGEMRDPAAADAIARALASPRDAHRRAAAAGLGKIAAPRAAKPLISALSDKNDGVRQAAAVALGRIGDPPAIEPLVALLADPKEEVRSAALPALARLTGKDLPLDAAAWRKWLATGEGQKIAAGALRREEASRVALLETHTPLAWPPRSGSLLGRTPVRVRNPNAFWIRVGLRSGAKGRDFVVRAWDTETVYVPDGDYVFVLQYSADPGALSTGKAFSLAGNGVEVEVDGAMGGNCTIRKPK